MQESKMQESKKQEICFGSCECLKWQV